MDPGEKKPSKSLKEYFSKGAKEKFYLTFATFFGAGLLPKAPGTWASISALIIILFQGIYLFSEILLAVVVLLFIVSIPVINDIEKAAGDDPSFVVIDEVLGMWLILASPFYPKNIIYIVIVLILFRIFDISKVFPINLINRRKGAFFVLADDIMAAIFTLIIIQIIHTGVRIFSFYIFATNFS